jgi:enoyl-CoA hydratase
MPYQHFLFETDGAITTVTINRPAVLNAMSPEVTAELAAILDEVDESRARVLILTGAGERAFSAGADLKTMIAMSAADARAELNTGNALMRHLEHLPQVTIAAVNGYALGGGTEIALACDLRVASRNAVFGLPEVKVGVIPGWGGTQRLPRLVGRGIALELLCTGRNVPAEEALRIGLVNRVVDLAELLPTVRQLAGEIEAASPIAVQQAKRAVDRGLDMALDAALAFNAEAWLVNYHTEDRYEGMKAFLDKRKPEWKGR